MSTIDRVRFYDGEFLRAADFSDEQTYHTEMRRRLNRYLHLYGIVQGLRLHNDTQAGVTQVSILPGMAIDAFGREIYLFQPYTFGDNDVSNNRISSPANYDVWLRYQKTPSTPPSAGYAAGNQKNQYTRWVESFSVVLLSSPSIPFTDPRFATDDTDNPSQDDVGVLLGTVHVDPTSPTGTFYGAQFDPNRCTLLGLIAQRIQTPPRYDAMRAQNPFSFLNANPTGVPNTPLSPAASLEIEPNLFADQNLIVGEDFPLTTPLGGPAVTITPGPTVTDPGSGSVKIAGDLFVQGNIYNLITSNTPAPSPPPPPFPPAAGTNLWLGIFDYVKQLLQSGLPDFVASQPVQIVPPPTAPSPTQFTATAPSIVIPSKLTAMSGVVAAAAISGIQLIAGVTFGGNVGVYINNVTGSPGSGQCTVSVTYTVTGVASSTPYITPILSFSVTATAVCFP